MSEKVTIIIGAGPAGLTAAYELLLKTDITPIIFETTDEIGGISKTVNYKGNRMDIGGHRFFSKSEKVTKWWLNVLPLQTKPAIDDIELGRPMHKTDIYISKKVIDPELMDNVMLVRERLSRIFFLRKFFSYPISMKLDTFVNLGLTKVIKTGISYIKASFIQIKPEKTLEDFFINRFGKELYNTFFKDYTEKVWGIACNRIKPEWGAQRIKGLSILSAVRHALKSIFTRNNSLSQKNVETSLIEQFMYPKFGPGQLWEKVAEDIIQEGGKIYKLHTVEKLEWEQNKITGVWVRNQITNELKLHFADHVISTMPIKDLIKSMGENVPTDVSLVASGLVYRDFITVGLLLKKMKIKNETSHKSINDIVPDNWIYIQERDVKVGRLQIFNNWSPYMVKDRNTVWLGLEYFCNEGDELWEQPHDQFASFAIEEMEKIGLIERDEVLDSTVIKIPKAYPAYFGSYDQLDLIRNFVNQIDNLYLVGRNGMHRYNNMDHSMLTAMAAVNNIVYGKTNKNNIWAIKVAVAFVFLIPKTQYKKRVG